MFWQRPLSAGFFLPMNSVGWAGLLLKTLPTAKSQRFSIGTSVQWDRASFVEGFEDKAFQGCVCMTIWLCFGFRVAFRNLSILPLENGWRVLFFSVVSKKAKFNFPIAARLCLAESLPHRAANVFKASSVESHRL